MRRMRIREKEKNSMLAEKKGNWRAYVYILIGTAVMAVSITSIYDHMQMVTG